MAAVNPKMIVAPSPAVVPRLVKIRAADSVTWKKGELAYLTSGTVAPLSTTTGGALVYGIFAEEQTASTSSTDALVYQLVDGCRLEIYVTNNGTDAAIGVANRGTSYAAYTKSNVSYLDVNVTSNAQFEVEQLAAEYEPTRHATADAPGKCIVVFRAS
jgi:hypothetical protein